MLADLKNPLNLSDSALESLAQALQMFEVLDTDFPERLLRYLVDDSDESVIKEMLKAIHQQGTQPQQSQLVSSPQGITRLVAYSQAVAGSQFTQPQQSRPVAFSGSHLSLFLTQMGYYGGLRIAHGAASSDKLLLRWMVANPLSDVGFYERLSLMMCSYAKHRIDSSGEVHLPSLRQCLPLFMETIASANSSLRQHHRVTFFIALDIMDALYVEAGEPPGTLARLVYDADPKDYRQQRFAESFVFFKGFADYSLKHADIVREVLQHPERDRRIHAMRMLKEAKAPIDAWLEIIVTAATASAKTEREIAAALLETAPQAAIPLLQTTAESGSSSERQYAVKLLWDLAGETIQPFLEQCLETEKTAKVQAAIAQLIAQPMAAVQEEIDLALPPLPKIAFETPLPEDAIAICQQIVGACQQAFSQMGQQQGTQPALPPDLQPAVLVDLLQKGSLTDCYGYGRQHLYWLSNTRDLCWLPKSRGNLRVVESFQSLLKLADIQLIHAVRLIFLTHQYSYIEHVISHYKCLFTHEGHELLRFYHTHHPNVGLRELAQVFELLKLPTAQIKRKISHTSAKVEDWEVQALDLSPERIGLEMLHDWGEGGFWRWSPEAIWPYFAEHLSLLANGIAFKSDIDWSQRDRNRAIREKVFKALKLFPQPPAQLVPTLWDLALEGPKNERKIAQGCLDPLGSTQARLLTTLSDPNRDKRTVVADWLGDRGDPATIEPLRQAARAEKSEAAKDIMLRSLEKLGASVDEFMDRGNLLQDSRKLLKKGMPKVLDWFPVAAMPPVHWQDTGEPVAVEILQGFIVKCFKQKTPEPGPILKRYVEMWQPEERKVLGQFVLESWIAQDTAPAYTPEEADKLAQKQAQQTFQYYQQMQQRHPNTYGMSYTPPTYEELYQRNYNELLNRCIGSATKEKGILAIAAACCGAQAVATINTYLKTWYGNRMAQCKALLQVLVWSEENSAIQLLLSVAERFRTKGIQKEAAKLVSKLAERNGWSHDELGDRTIPTAGFDQGVEQILDYGQRQFTLLLDVDLSLVLKNPDGKIIKSLPAARKGEDPDQVKAAKQQLSDTKKQLKQMLKLQRDRLYEAMCTQRAWRFCDWDTYLNRHPIMGRYCQQLVWAIYEVQPDGNEVLVQTVRPLEDRTLTDADDEEVIPEPTMLVRLAHRCTVSAETAEAWQTHFIDYDVTPLLLQFSASTYTLPADQQQATELDDFAGHIIEAFKLRGALLKRGYVRGQAEDGGWFYDYHKSFVGLGLDVVIDFSGNGLPEENRLVALASAAFHQLEPHTDSVYRQPKMPLADVPPVLLSEVRNELQAIAAQGNGYDPDWQKKVEF